MCQTYSLVTIQSSGVTFKRFFFKFYFTVLVVQGIKPRALLVLGKYSAADHCPLPLREEVLNGKVHFWEHCSRCIHAVAMSVGRKTTPSFLHTHSVGQLFHVLTKMNIRMALRHLFVQVLLCKGTFSGFHLSLRFNVTFLPGLHSTMKPKLLLFGLSQMKGFSWPMVC